MQLDRLGANSGTAGRMRQCIRIIYRFFKKDVKIKPERFQRRQIRTGKTT